MNRVDKKTFIQMSLLEKGTVVLGGGKHITQIRQGHHLVNLYSVNDFFVEVYYSIYSNHIVKIEVINDLSRLDFYIEENEKSKKLRVD